MVKTGEDPLPFDTTHCVSSQKEREEGVSCLPDYETGHSFLGITIASPELIVGTSSPDLHRPGIKATPDFRRPTGQDNQMTTNELPKTEECMEASFELPKISEIQNCTGDIGSSISINAGETDRSIVCDSLDFKKDEFFMGGDIIRTDAKIGDGKGLFLYQTARLGNCSYKFDTLGPGDYVVDLHLAEIVFTQGPPGMRVFDVFIQDEKVVSGIDIYAQVGANQPLILSDIKASVFGKEGLTIRFEGIMGSPLVCGISVRKDSSAGKRFEWPVAENITPITGKEGEQSQTGEPRVIEDECNGCKKLKRDHDLLFKEKIYIKRALEDVKKDNELKSRECHEAWMSLQELQMELMRKSMHVGSLAVAVEGQVKEKSRWFSTLRELDEKFELLKIEHAKLSKDASKYRRCLADIVSMTTTIQSAMNVHADLERKYGDLKRKYIDEGKGRRELYNKVLELKGNIRVFCRCRPLNIEETDGGASMVVDFEFAKDGELLVKAPGAFKKPFKFDTVFNPQADQETVFENTSPFATSVLDGYNVCIFAYGQTGTGKTFTMEGTEEARGVNYRTLEELFRIIDERREFSRYEISVSVLEVYNEQIRDLLLSGSQPGVAAKRLEIRQVSEGVHHIPGLVEARVRDMNEAWEVLQTGSNSRAVGSTNANEHSSRSHCIHCVMVKGENLMNGECTRSKLWLIDLAGSERVAKTDVQGERLKEAQNINRSLSALGDVISALATKSPHIPFRNSKLTHLLQDSLGGDSKTLMFVQISPNQNDISETLCSLSFASRVRGIELGPPKKQLDVGEVSRYKQMLEKAKQDIKIKDGHVKKMEETLYCLESKLKAKDLSNKNLQEKVKELESQLLIERRLARQHVDNKIAENNHREAPTKQPLVTQTLFDNHDHTAEPVNTFKELGNFIQPLTENNNSNNKPSSMPPTDEFLKYLPTLQKENKPDIADELLPRKLSRVSMCTPSRRTPIVPAPRRNSLIPAPAIRVMVAPLAQLTDIVTSSPPLPPPPLSVSATTYEREKKCDDPRSTKKFNSILRRSMQKKVIIRSPMQQHIRMVGNRGGAVGLEKVRVSVGSSGRKAQRVMVGRTGKGGDRGGENQKKEKERGWHHGTAVRNNF